MYSNQTYHWSRKETAFIYFSTILRDLPTASFLYGLKAPLCTVCQFSEMMNKTLEMHFSDKEYCILSANITGIARRLRLYTFRYSVTNSLVLHIVLTC